MKLRTSTSVGLPLALRRAQEKEAARLERRRRLVKLVKRYASRDPVVVVFLLALLAGVALWASR